MRNHRLSVCLLLCAGPGLRAQQDILYYKLEEGAGASTLNFAAPGGPAPREGAIVSNDVSAFAPGRFGAGSMRGAASTAARTYIDTGWNGTFTGDFSIGWWMLQRVAPTGTAYVFDLGNVPSTQSSFRCFTGGVAGRGLYLRYWGGTPNPLVLTYDVQTGAAATWVHIAVVVDSVVNMATWYVNGQVHTATPSAGTGNVVTGAQNFFLGYYTQFTGVCNYDLDEFRFLNRAALPVEVMLWAQRPAAADGTFGVGCGLTLASQGGTPFLGNVLYRLAVGGGVGAGFVGIGVSRTSLGPIPLPLDLGIIAPSLNGCLLHSSLDFSLGAGGGFAALPIPTSTGLDGLTLYAQAVLLGATGWQTSNALGLSLGY